MKSTTKLLAEWERLSIEEQLPNFPKRVRHELPECIFKEINPPFESLFLHGPTGTGKTMYATYYVQQAIKQTYMSSGRWQTSGFVTMVDLLQEIRHTFQSGSKYSELDIVNKYNSYDWLVLDDLGVESVTDWSYSVMYSLINRRYENMTPVIITSNKNLVQLTAEINDTRIISRIREMCIKMELPNIKRKPK